MHDLETMTLINEFVGNNDDYATQGNNYYLYFPKQWPARIFGVDFDSINFDRHLRNNFLEKNQSVLYKIIFPTNK
jgi:hypothetical protein